MDTGMDVLPDLFGFVPAQTQCGYCGKIILLTNAVITQFIVADIIVGTEHFCGETCAMQDAPFKADNE